MRHGIIGLQRNGATKGINGINGSPLSAKQVAKIVPGSRNLWVKIKRGSKGDLCFEELSLGFQHAT